MFKGITGIIVCLLLTTYCQIAPRVPDNCIEIDDLYLCLKCAPAYQLDENNNICLYVGIDTENIVIVPVQNPSD